MASDVSTGTSAKESVSTSEAVDGGRCAADHTTGVELTATDVQSSTSAEARESTALAVDGNATVAGHSTDVAFMVTSADSRSADTTSSVSGSQDVDTDVSAASQERPASAMDTAV